LRNLSRGPAGTAAVLEKLEFLLALAREKHFGRAAEVCGVTQPTLSAGVKQIEDAFGVLLVNRGSRFRGFTAEGERVLEWARRIVGDARAMREEVLALKHGLAGRLRLAVVPTALPMVETLTTPLRARHPNVQFTVLTRTSAEVRHLLDNLEVDAGLTYLNNESPGRVTAVPLYRESYRLLVAANGPLGHREQVTWSDVAQVPLCLLTPDMQNRRIIDQYLRETGVEPTITLESDSMLVLYSHVRTGRWASVMPSRVAAMLGLTDVLRAIPIIGADTSHTIGLVAPAREPMIPLTAALVAEARRVAVLLAD
jgi:DNA-binding transcriptional LysR family regulator